jgi:hypothetical protein
MRSRLGIGPSPLADEPAIYGGEEFSPAVVQTRVGLDGIDHADRRCSRSVLRAVTRVGRQLLKGYSECVRDRHGHREGWLTLPGLVAPDLPRVNSCGRTEISLRHAEFGSASANDFGHLHRRSSSRTLPSLDNRTYIADRERQHESAVLRTEESAQKGDDATEAVLSH